MVDPVAKGHLLAHIRPPQDELIRVFEDGGVAICRGVKDRNPVAGFDLRPTPLIVLNTNPVQPLDGPVATQAFFNETADLRPVLFQ